MFNELKQAFCTLCELSKNCQNPDMQPIGNENADIYILGEYPSDRDDLMGKPFKGKSGGVLNAILEYLKVDLNNVRYYNAINCKAREDKVTDLQIEACRLKVLNDIKKTKPKIIVAMGNAAMKCLLNKSEPGIHGWRGWQIPCHELNCWILPTFPVSKILKDGIQEDNKIQWTRGTNHTDTLRVLREDLSIIPDLINTPIPKVKPFTIKRLLKFDEVMNFFDTLNTKDFVMFDIETLGLRPYFKESCILTASFSFDDETAYAFPISYYYHIDKKKWWNSSQEQQILNKLKEFLLNDHIVKGIHNSVFEREWALAIFGIEIKNVEDSMLQKYILDCRNGTHSLGFLSMANFGYSWKNFPDYIMNNLTQVPLDELLDYNGKDTIFEYRLFKLQEKPLSKNKTLYSEYREQVEYAKVIAKMEFDGAYTNEESRENLLKDYVKERERLEKELLSLDSVKEFINKYGKVPALKSNSKDIPIILFKIENLDPFKKTSKGNNSVDKEVLSKYSINSDFCRLLLKFREYAGIEGKILGSYTECIFPDEKYHGGFFPVETGRLNSTNPNLQNMDKRKHPEIRQIIVAPEGHVLLVFDQCFHPNTEYLTKRGWVGVLDLQEMDEVWQVNKNTLMGEFVKPTRIIKKEYSGLLYTFDAGKRGNLSVTENHRMLWVGQVLHKTKRYMHDYRKETLSQEEIPNSGCHSSCFSYSDKISNYSEKEIWLAALLEADSYYDEKYNKYVLQISLPRKREKIKELLGFYGTVYEKRTLNKLPVEYWRISFDSPLLNGKKFDLSSLGQNQAKIFKEALIFWDDSYYRYNKRKNGREYWNSTDKLNVDEVQKYFVTSGYECFVTQKQNNTKNVNWKPCYRVSIKEKGTIRFGSIFSKHLKSSIKVNKTWYDGQVGCISVPSGFILVRNEGQTFVTGNCQLEARILAAVSNCRSLIEAIKTGYDIHKEKAIEIWGEEFSNASKETAKLMRYRAKNEFVFPSFYGAKPPATAKRLNISESKATQLLEKLWNDFPEIKTWQEELLKIYDKKRYVEIPPGRRRHAPLTVNEILNTPIQGGAASIIRKAMIELCKLGYYMILQCHDEIVICVKEKEAKNASKEIQYIMEKKFYDFMGDTPLSVEGFLGGDWYTLFPLKEIFDI